MTNQQLDRVVPFETGVAAFAQYIRVRRIGGGTVYASVYGPPDSGKSVLISGAIVVLTDLGYTARAARENATGEDIEHLVAGDGQQTAVIFEANTVGLNGNDPAYLVHGLGKELSVRVAIYNPDRDPVPSGSYDMIVANPESRAKKKPENSGR